VKVYRTPIPEVRKFLARSATTGRRTWSGRCCCRGSKVNTTPTDFFPVKQMQLMRFDGTQWVLFGDIIG
jgi:hypothetical protein